MAGRLGSLDLLEELDAIGGTGARGGPGRENQDAYRMGRNAIRVTPSVLSAKMRQFDDKLSGWIVTLKARDLEFKEKFKPVALTRSGIAIVTGLLVLAAAFSVDFMIIQEFWKRVLANEFGEVPKSLAMNVLFKSAQVLFATLAFHFMLETLGKNGKRIFVWFIFGLTFCMLLGIGLIVAKDWLPPGSELFGAKMGATVESADTVLKSLGLGDDAAPAAAAPGALTDDGVKSVTTIVWLGSLSVIFIIVTGVGSLCMGIAIRGFQSIFGDLSLGPHAGGAAQRSESVRVTTALAHLEDPRKRWQILDRHLSDFVTSYAHGLHRYEVAWFGVARLFFPRAQQTHELQLDMDEAKSQVEQEWSLEFVRERHPVAHGSSTAKDALDTRKEPQIQGGAPESGEPDADDKVVPLRKRLFGRRSGDDE